MAAANQQQHSHQRACERWKWRREGAPLMPYSRVMCIFRYRMPSIERALRLHCAKWTADSFQFIFAEVATPLWEDGCRTKKRVKSAYKNWIRMIMWICGEPWIVGEPPPTQHGADGYKQMNLLGAVDGGATRKDEYLWQIEGARTVMVVMCVFKVNVYGRMDARGLFIFLFFRCWIGFCNIYMRIFSNVVWLLRSDQFFGFHQIWLLHKQRKFWIELRAEHCHLWDQLITAIGELPW